MKKKYWIVLLLALAMALAAGLWISGEALAQDPSDTREIISRWRIVRRGFGQVIDVNSDEFSVRKQNGDSYVLVVNENTRFRTADGGEASFEDLQIDRWVVVLSQRSDSAERIVRLVVILPEDFDPSQFFGARGLIASVDLAADQFTLQTAEGEGLLFNVDENTRFLGDIQALDELEPNMQAVVRAKVVDDSDPLALVLLTGEPREGTKRSRIVGQIEEIDTVNQTISIAPRRGGDTLTGPPRP